MRALCLLTRSFREYSLEREKKAALCNIRGASIPDEAAAKEVQMKTHISLKMQKLPFQVFGKCLYGSASIKQRHFANVQIEASKIPVSNS
jgi:hypothetical protein